MIRQISIFLENKAGKLLDVVRLLAKEKINMRALSIAETSDFGILRLIVDDTDKAAAVFKENGYVCSVTPVIAVIIPDEPGGLENVLSIFARTGVSIDYSYACLTGNTDSACLVLKVPDMAIAVDIMKSSGAKLLTEEDITAESQKEEK